MKAIEIHDFYEMNNIELSLCVVCVGQFCFCMRDFLNASHDWRESCTPDFREKSAWWFITICTWTS